jgi:TPP-dependent indolepyruvate ferredoxin oxidoreductase alpha subunit
MHKLVMSDIAYDWFSSRVDLIRKNMKKFPSNYDMEFVLMFNDLEAAMESSQHTKDPKPPKEDKPKAVRSAPMALRDGCTDHVTYQAKRRPQTDCEGCWSLYKKLHPLEYDMKRREFERKQSE